MQTASQPPQALFPRSHNLLALTDYLTSLGSTLVFNSVCFALLPLHCLPRPLSLSCFLFFHILWLPENPNSFIFPSNKDLEDLISSLTGNISKQLLKIKRGFVKHCAMTEKVLTYSTSALRCSKVNNKQRGSEVMSG